VLAVALDGAGVGVTGTGPLLECLLCSALGRAAAEPVNVIEIGWNQSHIWWSMMDYSCRCWGLPAAVVLVAVCCCCHTGSVAFADQ
jgi:hypothetical protein